MTKNSLFRPLSLFVVFATIAGCASTAPEINPDVAFADDGVDYYSEKVDEYGDISTEEQWLLSENGERIYTLNSATVLGDNLYYVGDIRALETQTNEFGQPRVDQYGRLIIYDNSGYPVDPNARYRNSLRNSYSYGSRYPLPQRRGSPAPTDSAPPATNSTPDTQTDTPATPQVSTPNYSNLEPTVVRPRPAVRQPRTPVRRAESRPINQRQSPRSRPAPARNSD